MKKAKYCVRQGDVLLVQVKNIPTEANKSAKKNEETILAYGEATGHAHRIKETDSVEYLMTEEGERFLQRIRQEIEPTLTHEEHGKIHIVKDYMQQGFQVEDYGKEIRRVTD